MITVNGKPLKASSDSLVKIETELIQKEQEKKVNGQPSCKSKSKQAAKIKVSLLDLSNISEEFSDRKSSDPKEKKSSESKEQNSNELKSEDTSG